MGVTDKIEKGQEDVNNVVSFVNWLRYIVDWVKDLLGK
jgi:hypothetical protein